VNLHTNEEARQATAAVSALRRVLEIEGRVRGEKLVPDPGRGDRPPSAGTVYPALVRSMIAKAFDDAEREDGLDRLARVALEAWALATVSLNGEPLR